MDLDQLSLDDLRALRANNLDAMSLDGLQKLKAFQTPPAPEVPHEAKTGVVSAFTSSLKSGLGSTMEGLGTLVGADELAKKGKQYQQEAAAAHEDTNDQDIEAARNKGWLPLAGAELSKNVLEPAAGMAGNMIGRYGAPIAAAAAATALAPEGAALAGIGAGTAAFAGTNLPIHLGEMVAAQKNAGQEANYGKAILPAIVSTAIDSLGGELVGGAMKGFALKTATQEAKALLPQVLTGQLTAEEASASISGKLKNVLAGTVEAAGAGTAMMVGNTAATHAALGQDMFSPEAMKEYVEQAKTAGILAPFLGLLHAGQPGKAIKMLQGEEAKGIEQRNEIAREQQMGGNADLPTGPEELDAAQKETELRQRAVGIANQRRTAEANLDELRKQASTETDLNKLADLSKQAEEHHAALDAIDPDKVKEQINSLNKENKDLQKQLGKVQDDPEAAEPIQTSLEQNQAKVQDLTDHLEAIKYSQVETATAEEVARKVKAKQKELEKAKANGDLLSVGKIAQEIKDIQTRFPGDATAPYRAYQARLAEEQKAREQRAQEALEQEQAANESNQEIDQSTGEYVSKGKYREQMTSDEYTDLLAQKLVDLHTRPDTHVPTELTPAQKAAETKRVNAINVLKDNFTKAASSYDELLNKANELGYGEKGRGTEVYTARGDLAALGKQIEDARLAMEDARGKMIDAIPDGVKTPVESGRVSEIAQDVHLLDLTDTIDSMRKGEFFGGPNPKQASGFLAALAEKARGSLDKYIQSTVSRINYERLAKDMPRLTEEQKADIVRQLDDLMTGKIQRATGKKARAMVLAERLKNPLKTDLADVEAKMEPLKKQGYTAKSSPVVYAALENKANEIKAAIAKVDAAVENGTVDQLANQYGIDTTSMPNALRRAGFRTTEQEIETGFHRDEYKDVQRFAEGLKNKYTNTPIKEIGKLQRLTPEAKARYAVQEVLTKKQAEKNKAKATPAVEKTAKERTEESQAEAERQTGLDLAGKKQTFEPAEKLQAALPHQGRKVETAFNFAKQYFKEWNARKSKTLNAKQLAALKEARQKYVESRAKLNEQFKNSQVDPRIAKIMNWMVTADEKTAEYRKAQNRIIGLEEKMQDQVFAKTPAKKITEIKKPLTEAEKKVSEDIGEAKYNQEIADIERAKSPAEKAVGQITETRLAEVNSKLKEKLKAIRDRIYGLSLQDKEATAAERAELAEKQTALEKQVKNIDTILNARRVGMIIGQAQEEQGSKRYKPSKAEKAMEKEGKFEEAGITPEVYANVAKTVRQIEAEKVKAKPTTNLKISKEARSKIKELAGIETELEHTEMTPTEKSVLTRKRDALRKEISEEATKKAKDLEALFKQEAKEADMGVDAYMVMADELESGEFHPRIGEGKNVGVQMAKSEAQAVVDKVKLPKGLDVKVIQTLPETMKQYIRDRGYDPEKTKGFVTEKGNVVIVADAHATPADVAATVAHEVTGHLGVAQVLGKEGMERLVNKITAQEGSVQKLADKLGVGDEAAGAYQAAIDSGKTEQEAKAEAVHEMIAHVEEQRPSKDFVAKANDFIKALVGEVRAALRKMGLNLDINTSDIYKILRDARNDFKEVNPGAYKTANGDIQFRSKAKYNSKFSDLGDDVGKIVQANKTVRDKVHAAAVGFKTPRDILKTGGMLSQENRLAVRTRYIDRFAPAEKVAEKLTAKLNSSLEGTQLMYYLRMFDQGINWVAQTASHGPMSIIEKKRADGKLERLIETKEGASMLKVSQALKAADVGDANAANQLFTFYLAGRRAARVGLNTLNFSKDVTQEMLDKVMKRINSDAKTKAAFEKAANIYNDYNRGLVEFGVQTGRFSKEEAARLLKENDYVPFYRTAKDGSVMLEMGGAQPIHIGNIKNQPYLHELVGGDTAIMDVFTSALQNTRMLTDMSLRNLATRNVAFSLKELGLLKIKTARGGKEFGSGIYKGKDASGPDVIHFKINGEDYHAIVDTDSVGIPSELLVKGMDGVQTSIPNLVKVAGYPARLLRSFITRNPAYAVRQIARDSLSNAFVTGSNSIPIVDNLKQLGSMLKGTNEGELLLKRRGILGGQVLGNASDAMQKAMLQIIDGKPGWEKAMGYLDHVAMMGDASSRVTSYNSFIKQGASDMEATLASLEAMNFSKKGTSPSLYLLNHMVPFLNAQIQGLDVLYKAFAGKMPLNDKLDIKNKIWQRGAMMAAFTMAYTALNYDDEDYKNATSAERIGNWFIKVPGIDEKVKVPIPFEVGGIFKMLPEMLYSTAFKDKKLGDAAAETSKYVVDNFLPSFTPTAVKPMIELGSNYSFFTGKPIESQRLQELAPGQRSYATTPEAIKAIGAATNISPVKMEYLIRNYTGALPLALLSLANPVAGGAEAPEGRGALSSTTPIVGAFFQPKDANGLIDKAYEQMDSVIQANNSYKNLVESGQDEEAEALMTKQADLIGMASFSGNFRHQMGELSKQERAIRAMTGINGAEKRAALDEIKEARIELSKAFLSARE